MRRWGALVIMIAGALVFPAPARSETPPGHYDRTPPLDAGAACFSDYACASGFCVDGVCCGTTCPGTCHQCNRPDTLGTCAPALAGTDPRGACPGSGPCRATCNGSGLCAYPGDDVVCEAAECIRDTSSVKRGRTCDGRGWCVDRGTQDCAPFTCRAGSCPTTCVSGADCAIGAMCLGTSCGESRPAGAPCFSAAECASGSCAHGVCCDTECTGICERCDQPNPAGIVDGTCRVLEGQSPSGACPGQGLCVGECSAQGMCAWPSSALPCDLCVACDGAGACNALPDSKDDIRCGDMHCGMSSGPCMTLEAGPRCVGVRSCATPGTGSACTVRVNRPDGTSCWAAEGLNHGGICLAGACVPTIPDGGLPDGGLRDAASEPQDSLSDRDERRYAVCGCTVDERPGLGLGPALLALAALALRVRPGRTLLMGGKRDEVSR
ncbi:MAG: hypothetical protein HY906_27150 [Deltaproteobacteria bacterium]|nr:hypothetical protein [Deltaproteobacteria bacterium]